MEETYYKIFETERLILKPTSVEDAAFFCELYNSSTWIEYIGDRNIKTIEKTREFIENEIMPQLFRLGYSNFTVIRKSDQSKIGSCGLCDRDGIVGVDIGFAFLPEFGKKGYAFEAVDKLKRIALEEFKLESISAFTTENNFPSQRLLMKLGLAFSKMILLDGEKEEVMFYELEKTY